MNQGHMMRIGITLAALMLVLFNAAFIVRETDQAIVFQFREPKKVYDKAGLKWKIPFMQTARTFDKRLLDFDGAPETLVDADQKQIMVGAYVRYRIVDPLQFVRATGGDIGVLNSRLAPRLESSLRQEIGRVLLKDLLSPQRDAIMTRIRDLMNGLPVTEPASLRRGGSEANAPSDTPPAAISPEAAKAGAAPPDAPVAADATAKTLASRELGIEVADVRLTRVELPPENSEATFKRMHTDREKEANQLRAQGEQEAQGIRSRAERDRSVILAEASRQGEITRGEGDAQAAHIYADAFSRDPEFFRFYRSMQAYRKTLDSKDTTIVLAPDSGFLRYFKGEGSSRP